MDRPTHCDYCDPRQIAGSAPTEDVAAEYDGGLHYPRCSRCGGFPVRIFLDYLVSYGEVELRGANATADLTMFHEARLSGALAGLHAARFFDCDTQQSLHREYRARLSEAAGDWV